MVDPDDYSFPVYDITEGFLQGDEFQKIADVLPVGEWCMSNVHRKETKEDVVDPSVRCSMTVKERRREVLKSVEKTLLKPLLRLFRQDDRFRYLVIRLGHTEWLRYWPSMYFLPHKDFERYTCNGMVPYVALLGMTDTQEGGKTKWRDTVLEGSTHRNGLSCFPSNEIHEAEKVVQGVKLVLKVELFVFFSTDQDFMMLSDASNRWRSFWRKSGLSLCDNFIDSYRHFVQSDTLQVSSDMARALYRAMLSIASGRYESQTAKDFNLVFPGQKPWYVHDLMCTYSLLRTGKPGDLYLGTDATAWHEINRGLLDWTKPGEFTTGVALYVRREQSQRFVYYMACCRQGLFVEKTKPNTFLSFQDLKEMLVHRFILDEEIFALSQPVSVQEKPEVHDSHLKGMSNTIPTDRLSRISTDPKFGRRIEGRKAEVWTEMCNDEESGFVTDTYSWYVTVDLQIRWYIIKTTT